MLISVNKLNSSRQILADVSVGYKDNSNKINPKYFPVIKALRISIYNGQLTLQTRYGAP